MKEQYLSKSDKYDYLLDKIDLQFQTKQSLRFKVEGIAFRDNKHFVGGKRNFYIARRSNGFMQALYFEKINFNEIARDYLKEKYANKWRVVSKSVFAHDTNFLPAGARLLLKNNGISISKLRKSILSKIFSSVEQSKKTLADILSDISGLKVTSEDIEVYISYAELNYDLLCGVDENLTCVPKVYNGFNRLSDEVQSGYYEGGIFKAAEFKTLGLIYSSTRKPSLKIQLKMHNQFLGGQLYEKEQGGYGTLNRFELRFHKTILRELLPTRKFETLDDLQDSLNILAECTFKFLYKVMRHKPRKQKSKRQLKKLIMMIFSGKSWLPMWEAVNESWVISTQLDSQIPKACKYLIPKLAKNDVLFKKVGRGQFKITQTLLKSSEKNYFRFKNDDSD